MADPTITIRLPADLITDLDALARQDKITRSKLVRRMLLSEVGVRKWTKTGTLSS